MANIENKIPNIPVIRAEGTYNNYKVNELEYNNTLYFATDKERFFYNGIDFSIVNEEKLTPELKTKINSVDSKISTAIDNIGIENYSTITYVDEVLDNLEKRIFDNDESLKNTFDSLKNIQAWVEEQGSDYVDLINDVRTNTNNIQKIFDNYDTSKTVDKKIEDVKNSILGENLSETFNTLKAIEEWSKGQESDYITLLTTVESNRKNINDINDTMLSVHDAAETYATKTEVTNLTKSVNSKFDNVNESINNYQEWINEHEIKYTELFNIVDNKVDKEEGKILSSNDYTTDEKEKLAALPTNEILTSNINAIKTWVEDKNYLIETDLNDYAKSVDVTSEINKEITKLNILQYEKITDAATKYQPIGDYLTEQSLINYVTINNLSEELTESETTIKTWVEEQNYLTADTIDLTEYAKTSDVDTKLDNLKKSILGEGLSEAFDTLKDVEDWINKHKDTEYSDLLTRISNVEDNKVDKIEGKGLSTNDYTTDDKNKLTALPTNNELNSKLSEYAKTSEVTSSISTAISNLETTEHASSTYQPKGDYATNTKIAELNEIINNLKRRIEILESYNHVLAITEDDYSNLPEKDDKVLYAVYKPES